MQEFKMLRSFNARIQYCQGRLKRISSGSSRIVYQIDQEKVLKLAKNTKGLAQNEAEVSASNDYMIQQYGLTANVFEHHREHHWVEMELAQKLSPKSFQTISGFSWKDFQTAIHNAWVGSNGSRHDSALPLAPETYEAMWEDHDFVFQVFDYIGNFDLPVGDLQRTSSWGIVQREGDPTIVMIDYGLTVDVQSNHYAQK